MSSSVISVPNALTFLRFLGIPLFSYLTLNLEADGWAIVVLAIGGATDYFDGKIARAWNQTSRLVSWQILQSIDFIFLPS